MNKIKDLFYFHFRYMFSSPFRFIIVCWFWEFLIIFIFNLFT